MFVLLYFTVGQNQLPPPGEEGEANEAGGMMMASSTTPSETAPLIMTTDTEGTTKSIESRRVSPGVVLANKASSSSGCPIAPGENEAFCLLCSNFVGKTIHVRTSVIGFSPATAYPVRCTVCPGAPIFRLQIEGKKSLHVAPCIKFIFVLMNFN